MVQVTEIDFVAELGREYRVTIQMPDGEEFAVVGKFLELVPGKKVRFTWQWDGSEIQPFDTEVCFTFSPLDGGTLVKLVHSGFKLEEYMGRHQRGWTGALSRLVHLQSGIQDKVSQAARFAAAGHARFTTTFAAVPKNKLDWTPSETAKTPIQIAAHTAVTYHTFAGLISGDCEMPADMGTAKTEARITTREQADEALSVGFQALTGAIDCVTPERFAAVAATPYGEIPIEHLIFIPGTHGYAHAAQIDYLQTCWGDMDDHM